MRRFRTLKVPVGIHPVVRRVFTECNEQRIGLQDLSDRSGLDYEAIVSWRRSQPLLPSIDCVLGALGLELNVREKGNIRQMNEMEKVGVWAREHLMSDPPQVDVFISKLKTLKSKPIG